MLVTKMRKKIYNRNTVIVCVFPTFTAERSTEK